MERDNYPVLFYIAVCCILFWLTFFSRGVEYGTISVRLKDGGHIEAHNAMMFYENYFWRVESQITIEAEKINYPDSNKDNYVLFESKGSDKIVLISDKVDAIVAIKDMIFSEKDLTESQ